jgi:hypothetical protein
MRKSVVSLVSLSLLGALAGQLVVTPKVGACECSQDSWRLELDQVTTSDPNVDHSEYWPAMARLIAWEEYVSIEAEDYQEGSVSYAHVEDFSR